MTENVLKLNGFNIVSELRKDRSDTQNGIGGGLLVYSRERLDILPSDQYNNDFNQYCNFKISTSNSFVNIVLVYRPPNCSRENSEKLIKLIENATANTMFIGDFNLPKINWNNLTCDGSNNVSAEFLDKCLECNFSQYVNFPTHSRNNILDLVLCNDDSVISIDNLGPLGNSDHVMMMINTNHFMKREAIKDYVRYDWNKADYGNMKNELNRINWEEEINRDIHKGWKLFKDSIQKVIDKNVPKIVCKGDNKKPIWMNSYIKRLKNKKPKLYKKMKAHNSEENVNNYNDLSKELKNAVRRAKRRVEINISKQTGNAGRKKFTSYVKSKMSDKKGIGPLLDENKNIVSDDKKMADLLNKHFSSVFIHEENEQLGPNMDNINIGVEIGDINITYDKVAKKIDELKVGKSPGPDGITNNILKQLKASVIKPLQILFQLSIETGDMPEDWKLAKVIAIFKKGARGLPTNHRPVSLTSGVCKMLEGIVREEITDHLYTNNLLKMTQHGFMKERSCQTNLLEFLDFVTQALDNSKPLDAIYLDFSKAFDKISHPKLIQKLQAHGVSGNVRKWIEKWLTNRKQYVSVNGEESDVELVTSGVPQGSVLGPLLFIIFINDIDDATAGINMIRKFADDTKIANIVETQEDAENLQECLNRLYKWSQDWSMEFNIKKCKVMHIGRRNQSFNYTINGIELSKVEKERDIGVCVHSNLKPSQHIQESVGRARAVLGQITRCFHFRDKVVFLRLYKQFVRPHLEFSSSVWSPWSILDIQSLENVQRKAIGMISGLTSRTYEDRLTELNLWTLEQRRKMFDMVQVHKIVNKIGNVECGLKFVQNRENNLTRTRAEPLNLVKSRCNLEIRRNFFCERVVEGWNLIPSDIKHTADVKKFKQKLVEWMQLRV